MSLFAVSTVYIITFAFAFGTGDKWMRLACIGGTNDFQDPAHPCKDLLMSNFFLYTNILLAKVLQYQN